LSLATVLVVASPPHAFRFVATLGRAVEPLVHTPHPVQSARKGGIGMEDCAVLECERTHTRPFANVCGHISSSRGRVIAYRRPFHLSCHPLARAHLPGRLAVVVILDLTVALLLFRERDPEIVVEVIAERGCPRKRPTHSPLIRLQLREWRPRHAHEGD